LEELLEGAEKQRCKRDPSDPHPGAKNRARAAILNVPAMQCQRMTSHLKRNVREQSVETDWAAKLGDRTSGTEEHLGCPGHLERVQDTEQHPSGATGGGCEQFGHPLAKGA
jgi:hypothetical protein